MNTDIRISISLPRHRKYLRLKRLIGESPMEYLIKFWITIAEQIPNGALNGWSNDDIEDAADWQGEHGKFAESLLVCGFIEKTKNGSEHGFVPHNWAKHQPWAVNAKSRSEAAKIAGKASANKRRQKFGTAQPPNGSRTERSTVPERLSNPRTPSPSPTPLKSKDSLAGGNNTAVTTESSRSESIGVGDDKVSFG